jgi:hypothetical protein
MLIQLPANPNTKKNMEAVVVASKEVGLEVNPDTTRYKFMSCRGPNNKTKTANKSFEGLMKFKLELNQQIKTAFTKKLVDKTQEMPAIIHFRMFILPLCCLKT